MQQSGPSLACQRYRGRRSITIAAYTGAQLPAAALGETEIHRGNDTNHAGCKKKDQIIALSPL